MQNLAVVIIFLDDREAVVTPNSGKAISFMLVSGAAFSMQSAKIHWLVHLKPSEGIYFSSAGKGRGLEKALYMKG